MKKHAYKNVKKKRIQTRIQMYKKSMQMYEKKRIQMYEKKQMYEKNMHTNV